jgi:hypothetical protein
MAKSDRAKQKQNQDDEQEFRRYNSEFFVRGIGNLVSCLLNRLFRITGELFTLAFRPLSEAFGLQLFRAGGFTGCLLGFSRGLIGDARNFICGATHYSSPHVCVCHD